MAEQYVGKLKALQSKAGKQYFKGFLGNVPVVGFWGNKETETINLKLDVGYIKWKDEQDDTEKPQKPESTSQKNTAGSDDLPF